MHFLSKGFCKDYLLCQDISPAPRGYGNLSLHKQVTANTASRDGRSVWKQVSSCTYQKVFCRRVWVFFLSFLHIPSLQVAEHTCWGAGTAWLSPRSFPVGGWWQWSPLCSPWLPKPAPLQPTGIYSCWHRWRGNNKHHSDLVHSHWHSSTLNTARKVAPGGMLSKKPPLKGCTPHHVLVSPLEAHKAVAQLGSPLREMQWAEVATQFTGMLWDLLNECAWRTRADKCKIANKENHGVSEHC